MVEAERSARKAVADRAQSGANNFVFAPSERGGARGHGLDELDRELARE